MSNLEIKDRLGRVTAMTTQFVSLTSQMRRENLVDEIVVLETLKRYFEVVNQLTNQIESREKSRLSEAVNSDEVDVTKIGTTPRRMKELAGITNETERFEKVKAQAVIDFNISSERLQKLAGLEPKDPTEIVFPKFDVDAIMAETKLENEIEEARAELIELAFNEFKNNPELQEVTLTNVKFPATPCSFFRTQFYWRLITPSSNGVNLDLLGQMSQTKELE